MMSRATLPTSVSVRENDDGVNIATLRMRRECIDGCELLDPPHFRINRGQ